MHLESVREALEQLNSFRRCNNDNGLAEVERPKDANNDMSRVQFQRKRLLLHNSIQIISASTSPFHQVPYILCESKSGASLHSEVFDK